MHDIGQSAAAVSGELYNNVRHYFSQDKIAEQTFNLFEGDPETFRGALEAILLQQLDINNDLGSHLIALIEQFEQAISTQKPDGRTQTVTVNGSGSVAVDGAVAAGAHGFAAGGNIIFQQFQSPDRTNPTESIQRQWQAEGDYLQAAMKAYIGEMHKQLQTFGDIPESPYKGLFYYEFADEQIFFGREKEKSQLLDCIRGTGKTHWLTVVHGGSGSGKTSLIKAGVIPNLIREGFVTIYALPGWGMPYHGPDTSIRKRIIDAHYVSAPPGLSELTLHRFLKLASQGLNRKSIVIFIDQFEDFFIHLNSDERKLFIQELAKCYDDETLSVKFVLSLRKEYFSDLYELQDYLPTIFYNQLKIEPLNPEQAALAIKSPVARLGITYDPALVEALLIDLGQGSVEPPQLQIVCNSLYEARHSNNITLNDYIQMGMANGILVAHLARFMAGLGRRRAMIEEILVELISHEGTKLTLSHEELEVRIGSTTLGQELALLVQARLLRQDEYDGITHYELAHEYLIKEIREWISDEKIRNKEVQALIDRELSNWRIFGTVINKDRLQIIEKWLQGNRLQLSNDAQDLIEKSREKQLLDEQEQLNLIHSANVTSLDQLVLGIDHEINSPIASIRSNSQFLRVGVQEMKQVLGQLPGMLKDIVYGDNDRSIFLNSFEVESHDLLDTKIFSYIDTLSQKVDECIRDQRLWTILEDINQISDELQQASEKMSNLVTALSSFVYNDDTKPKLTDLHTGLDTAILLLGYELKHHFKISRQYTSGFLRIRGAPSQIVQLFTNLLMNCIEAADAKQNRYHNNLIEIKTYSHDSWAVVVISDNGIGIPPENLDDILKPGFTTKGPSHRGLGLSIVAQIVQRHNGMIEFTSKLQKGTSVTIKLPITDAEESYEQN